MEKPEFKTFDEGIEFFEETRWVILTMIKHLEEQEAYEQCAELYEHAVALTKEIEELKQLAYISKTYGRKVQFH
jgi:hypothetical protein